MKLRSMIELTQARNLYVKIERALHAQTWDDASQILQAQPSASSQLQVHVRKLFDLMRIHGRQDPEVSYASVQAILKDLSAIVHVQVIASLALKMRIGVLPYGIFQRVLASDS